MALPLLVNVIACTGAWAGLLLARCALAAGGYYGTYLELDALVFVSTMFLIVGSVANTKPMFMGAAMFGLTGFTWPFFDSINAMRICSKMADPGCADAVNATIAGEFILSIGCLVVGAAALVNIFFGKSDPVEPTHT
ncbi:hypothetical protein Pelo_3398 [Pelomyxa schiedti]|nr:hypothetical protein Pelo_3398 [Pelomyxa schiedti]